RSRRLRVRRGLRRGTRQWRRHALQDSRRRPASTDPGHGRHLEDLQAVAAISRLSKGTAPAVPFFAIAPSPLGCWSGVEVVANDMSCNVAMAAIWAFRCQNRAEDRARLHEKDV